MRTNQIKVNTENNDKSDVLKKKNDYLQMRISTIDKKTLRLLSERDNKSMTKFVYDKVFTNLI